MKKTVSSRAKTSQPALKKSVVISSEGEPGSVFPHQIARAAVEGYGPLSVTRHKRQTIQTKKTILPLPAQQIPPAHSTSELPLPLDKSTDAINTPPKETHILRLRLGKTLGSKKTSRLASAQDDNAIKRKHPALGRVTRRLNRTRTKAQPPQIDSFADFLAQHARVKSGSGYIPYHFSGREALRPIVERLDQILASGEPDVSLALCGGAQFGKTVLMLNLLAYLVAVHFRNVGY